MQAHLDGDGLARLLAVEDAFHVVLRRRGAFLHCRADFVPLTLDDHIRVSPWREKGAMGEGGGEGRARMGQMSGR